MEATIKLKENIKHGIDCFTGRLTVSPFARTYVYSVAFQYQTSGPFPLFATIFAGREVDVTVYSPSNVVAHITTQDVSDALASMSAEELADFMITDEDIQSVTDAYCNHEKPLGISLSGMLCAQSPAEIQVLMDAASQAATQAVVQ